MRKTNKNASGKDGPQNCLVLFDETINETK
jgi:hypothetical protein